MSEEPEVMQDVSASEVPVVPEEVTEPESPEEAISRLEKSYDERLSIEITKISQRMLEENQKVVAEAVDRIRKELAPPSEADIQKMLDQEYVEFKVTLPIRKNGESITRTFMIRELPQKAEKRIYAQLKKILIPVSTEVAALSMDILKGDAAKKLVQLMNTFEPAMMAMVAVTAVALNPYGDDEEITDEWVLENLSSTRIMKVVTAQVEVNKMRDFFSLLSRGMKLLTM